MSFHRCIFGSIALLLGTVAFAQTTPTLTKTLPSGDLVSLGTATSIDLTAYFGLPGVTGQLVQFDTVLGKFNVEVLPAAAPQNAQNFLNYVQSSSYANSFIHRSHSFDSGPTAIIQGGGYSLVGLSTSRIEQFNPVPLEYNVPNTRGTIAAARTPDPNSATSEWFINVRDNSSVLGVANGGGYTVFGRVIGSGMTIVDALAALPHYDAGGAFTELPLRDYTPGNPYTVANFAIVNSVTAIPMYPTGSGTSLLSFTGTNNQSTVINAGISGSNLVLSPLSPGTATITIRATDTNGNFTEGSLTVRAVPPFSRSVGPAETATFIAPTGATAYQWQRNGVDLATATTVGLNLANVLPSSAGLYSAKLTTSSGVQSTRYAILGLNSTVKLLGNGTEFPNIFHAGTGFTYDQILLQDSAATVTADPGQILRISYIDLTDDIVQVEFSGPGSLTLMLDNVTGPAQPVNYSQNVSYMKGRGNIILTGATDQTNLTIFSVGRANAVDPTGAFNPYLPFSETNNPANNGSPLFSGHVSTAYDGWADLGFVAITSANGRFGGLRAANTRFSASTGLTGVYAPDVAFTGPVFVGDIDATGTATPCLSILNGSDVRITGGDLKQTNNRAVQLTGITQLKVTAGSTSHGTNIPAQNPIQGRLEQAGTDVTNQIVVYQ